MNNRTTILATLILVFAIGTNLITDRNDAPLPDETSLKNDPDLYMLNATITQFDVDGSLQHKIRADRFTHFPLTRVTSLIEPNLTLYSNREDEPWDIEARNGRLLTQSDYRSEAVELWQEVVARKDRPEGKFISIRTETLKVVPAREYAETNQKVSIDQHSGQTTAAGMQAYFEEGRFIFYSAPQERVHTVLLPEFVKSQ